MTQCGNQNVSKGALRDALSFHGFGGYLVELAEIIGRNAPLRISGDQGGGRSLAQNLRKVAKLIPMQPKPA
jgi:hypothetical protein